ncbi:B12-binding domain-containing radical SAM protein [Parasulfitobacter algicola]|uniref:Radical SAM protein n=1 Tax=Parasulfitobacter algicola TaxID=2614809 RepID=A0ABX2IRR7_9RHOB|nr:radical SAM protein [Sulfitobacter algicola]NSX53785.1 radical SAM protein [Sulfitobacter algicola]
MRIALISPKGPLYRHRGGIFKKSLRYQPLTLTTLTALAPPELDIEFQLYDEGIEDLPSDLNVDLIGMTVITGTAPRCYELAAKFRANGIPVVLGGPHVTLMPDEAAQHCDAICVGYAEMSWPRLLQDFAKGQLKGRYDQGSDFNLNQMVIPERDRLDRGKYITQAVFEATRACAHACDFCVSPSAWGRKQFQKPVEHVAHDIKQFGKKRNIFIDLNLISDRAYAKSLFEALVPLNIRWFGLVTSLIGRDPDLMELMAKSGCSGVLIGFESISTDALGSVHKKFNQPNTYTKVIEDLHRLNISIYGCFVFGYDTDDTGVFQRTADFAIDAGIDLPRFAIQTPFPGTPLYHRLNAEGRITTRDWELYDGQHVVYRPSKMTGEELQDGHVWAWQNVYSRRAILKRLAKSRTQLPISILANLGYRFYANHLHSHYTCDWPIGYELKAS